jgi:hypothetical protein
MNRKVILGISLTAAFAVSMVFAQNAVANGTNYLDITSVDVDKNGNSYDVKFTTLDTIPKGQPLAFGYGMFTGNIQKGVFKVEDAPAGIPENVFALTTHECVADHFLQGNSTTCANSYGILSALGLGNNEDFDGAEWHAHILDLTAPTDACSGFDAEVDLARTLKTKNNVIAEYTVIVNNNEIGASVPIGDLHSAKVAGFASFEITPVNDGPNTTNLCLEVTDFLPAS